MSRRAIPDRTVVQQLRHLRRQVGRVEDPGDPEQFLGVLESVLAGLADQVDAELQQARRTAGGAQAAVVRLSRDLRSAEDELGRLRPENLVLREKAQRADAVRGLDRTMVAAAAVAAVETALAREGEYLRLAHRELVVEAVLAVVDGLAWAA